MQIEEQARMAKLAAAPLGLLSTNIRNSALQKMADALLCSTQKILFQNNLDIQAAKEKGMKESFVERLMLTPDRIRNMADGLRSAAVLPDPIGSADSVMRRPNGLAIEVRRVPLGVVSIIFESRPNVTSDAIGLCIKSGNACILRSGSEAIRTCDSIASCMAEAAYQAGIPQGAIQLVVDCSHQAVETLMRLNGLVDVLIPRGGAGLISTVISHATVPVIQTGVGVCHTYIEKSADLGMAIEIVENAKCSRPSVCNATETLLIDAEIASAMLPPIAARLTEHNVELRCDEAAQKILSGTVAATEKDWSTEYNDLILSVAVVGGMTQAMEHIAKYGTGHSECIVTNDYAKAEMFLNGVDAAAVYVNASTRFTDGAEFGFGAEIGISTQKLHVRGPMGLSALTTVKYVIRGNGQIR